MVIEYLTHDESYWTIDIETDSLTPTVIWCVCLQNLVTEEEKYFTDAESFNEWHKETDRVYIGHNSISFDIPVLNRLWNSSIDISLCIDTLVLSLLYSPALEGGHSLESWGQRLRFPKIDFDDYSRLSQEMLTYCQQDVRLTTKLYKALTAKMRQIGYSELSCQIEHKIRLIIEEQITNGCHFDRAGAEDFCNKLRKLQSDLSESIHKLFPPSRTKVAEYTFRRTKDGRPHSSYEKHRAKYPEVILYEDEGKYECYDYVPFNLGSPKQRLERLLEAGYKPVSFTPKGNPKVDEDALVAFSEKLLKENDPRSEAVKALSEWLVITARLTTVAGNPETGSKGWLGNVQEDSRIHGWVNSCGAASRRMTHNSPNTANIPSAKKARYGKECRSFWGVPKNSGLCMVGYDAKGLETECFKHWLNNPKANEILDGDIHTDNAQALTKLIGREIDREWGAKTGWYAWMFGCYPPKLMTILKCTKDQAEQIWGEIFPNRIPGLKRFIDDIKYEWKSNKGRLSCIDGGFVVCPSESSALNYKIQPTGAVVMKLTSILIKEKSLEQGIWNRKLLDVHDEGQHEALEKEIFSRKILKKGETVEVKGHPFGELAVECIREAGRQLKFNVPLDGDYAVGYGWHETH